MFIHNTYPHFGEYSLPPPKGDGGFLEIPRPLWMIGTLLAQTLLVFHIESAFYFFGQFHLYAQFFFCHEYGFSDCGEGIAFAASWAADLSDGLQCSGGHAVGESPGLPA